MTKTIDTTTVFTREEADSLSTKELAIALGVSRVASRAAGLARLEKADRVLSPASEILNAAPMVSDEKPEVVVDPVSPEDEEEEDYETDADGRIIAKVAAKNDSENDSAPAPKSKNGSASLGISLSWQNPDVRAARLIRNAVMCNGVECRSVRAAFAMFGLPDEKHIKFRMQLKAAGHATFEFEGKEYKFVIC